MHLYEKSYRICKISCHYYIPVFYFIIIHSVMHVVKSARHRAKENIDSNWKKTGSTLNECPVRIDNLPITMQRHQGNTAENTAKVLVLLYRIIYIEGRGCLASHVCVRESFDDWLPVRFLDGLDCFFSGPRELLL